MCPRFRLHIFLLILEKRGDYMVASALYEQYINPLARQSFSFNDYVCTTSKSPLFSTPAVPVLFFVCCGDPGVKLNLPLYENLLGPHVSSIFGPYPYKKTREHPGYGPILVSGKKVPAYKSYKNEESSYDSPGLFGDR